MRDRHDEPAWRAPGCDAGPSPAVTEDLAMLDDALGELAELSLTCLDAADVTRLLDALTQASGRVTAALTRVVAEADRRQLGDRVGARDTGAWWAHRSRLTRGEAGRLLGLARRLDTDLHVPVAAALAAGRIRTDQAQVIVQAVDALPDDLADRTVPTRARDHLLAAAADHDARALRILGKRVLDVIAPEVAESEEQKRLEEEEARAAANARITFFDDGHGTCHGRFAVPSWHGALLREQLHSLADPRRTPTEDSDDEARHPVITPERLGEAFMEYIERYPADQLPRHGGNATTVTVTLDLDTLLSGTGAATLSTGGRISAGEARRLACEAGMVPVVLGGESVPLDLGRTRRLFTAAQRRALETRDGGCTADGCGLPPQVCHAHHDDPWSEGGRTDIACGRLLCPRHHRLAHDRRYRMEHGAGHRVTFHRRT